MTPKEQLAEQVVLDYLNVGYKEAGRDLVTKADDQGQWMEEQGIALATIEARDQEWKDGLQPVFTFLKGIIQNSENGLLAFDARELLKKMEALPTTSAQGDANE